MELRHLQYFLTIAREGTISGAAQALHLSQPSLSRQMQDLERELDVKLFNRGSRHIELTEEGMRLRRRAEEIVDLVGRTEAELRVSAETIAGEVRIGSGETPAMDLVARVIAEMQSAYPLVRFALHSGNAEDVRERLEKGLIDFGLFIGQVGLARYETLALPACDRWGVFMRRDDPLCAREVLRVEDLVDMPLILSAQGNSELGPWFHRDAGERRRGLRGEPRGHRRDHARHGSHLPPPRATRDGKHHDRVEALPGALPRCGGVSEAHHGPVGKRLALRRRRCGRVLCRKKALGDLFALARGAYVHRAAVGFVEYPFGQTFVYQFRHDARELLVGYA